MNSGPSVELVQEMHAYYQQGYSLVKTGECFHYTDSAVLYQFRKHGLPTRSSIRSRLVRIETETQQMYADYETGLSLKDVGKRWGYSETGVWGRFVRYGYARRPQGQPSWKTV